MSKEEIGKFLTVFTWIPVRKRKPGVEEYIILLLFNDPEFIAVRSVTKWPWMGSEVRIWWRMWYYLGPAVAQFVESLHYKPEASGFDSPWCHRNFSSTYSFRPHYGPRVESASIRNEYQEYFLGGKGGRCVGLTTSPPSCAYCHEKWKLQPPGILKACPGLHKNCFLIILTESKRMVYYVGTYKFVPCR